MDRAQTPTTGSTPQLREYRQKKLEAMRQNPAVLRFLEENQAGPEFLEQNSEMIDDYMKVLHQCSLCTGLANCPFPIRGRQRTLMVEKDTGFGSICYLPCQYARNKASAEAFQDNLWISHIDRDNQMRFYDQVSWQGKNNSYMAAFIGVQQSMMAEKGVFLYGQPGTGKSYLLSAMANDCAKRGQSVCYVRVPLLMSELKASITDDEFRLDTLRRLRRCDVLVLDDLGSESISAWGRDEILFPVLDERMNQGRKTYFASNLNPDELLSQYWIRKQVNGEVPARRLMERVLSLAQVIPLMGSSMRAKDGWNLPPAGPRKP